MTTIVVETRIAAPIELCFDLARDVEAHLKTSSSTGERAVGGKTSGLLDLGDVVTFEAVHFGIRQRLTSKIVELDRPRRFVDEMVKGAFASMRHVHEFVPDGCSVLMRDTLIWRSPWGVLGIVADKLFVEGHMTKFMVKKQSELKEYAERTTSGAGYPALNLPDLRPAGERHDVRRTNSMVSKSPNVAALDEVQAACGKVLRDKGFRRRGRSFNRSHQDGLVGVITFFAMPSWSCLHGAFNVELGIVLPCVPSIEHPATAHSKAWYQTCDCALRTSLPDLAGLPHEYLWDLRRSPLEIADEISGLLTSVGCPFLDKFTSYAAVVAHYTTHGALPGTNSHRSALEAAMIYHHLGDDDSARECFAEALNTDHKGFCKHVAEIRRRCLAEGA